MGKRHGYKDRFGVGTGEWGKRHKGGKTLNHRVSEQLEAQEEEPHI